MNATKTEKLPLPRKPAQIAATAKTGQKPVPPPRGAENVLKTERDARIDQHNASVVADPKKDGIPIALQVQNRKPPTPEQQARIDAAKAAARAPADVKIARQQEMRTKQTEQKKEKARVRVEKMKAKKNGSAQAMPLTGTAALKAIADAAIGNGHKIKKVPAGIRSAVPAKDSPKAAKPKSGKKISTEKKPSRGIGSVATAAILSGKTNEQALAIVMKTFPDCSSNLDCMNWYRNKLRKDGKLPKTAR